MKKPAASSQQLVAQCSDAFRILHSATSYKLPATSSTRGFTILLAALVASLVLTLGISVFTIAKKQLLLSSISKSSQLAFYAADTAAECALYWDSRHSYFGTTTPQGLDPSTVACDTQVLSTTNDYDQAHPYPYHISFRIEPNGYCADVTVTKDNVHPRTVIHADGFSTNCDNIAISARSLQRSVELTY